jgi:hypothetical protein
MLLGFTRDFLWLKLLQHTHDIVFWLCHNGEHQ